MIKYRILNRWDQKNTVFLSDFAMISWYHDGTKNMNEHAYFNSDYIFT